MKNKTALMGIITVVCIIVTVALWFAVNGSNSEYTEVSVIVLSAETKSQIAHGETSDRLVVTVVYEGETYELKNAQEQWLYPVGQSVTAYLSNGKLYADMAGVKTSTPLAAVYFAFLFISFIMLILTGTTYSKQKKQRAAQ